jgi:hypothetical protein
MHDSLWLLLFPVFLAGLWLTMLFLISRMGWSTLARSYRARLPALGPRWTLRTARIGEASARHVVTVAVDFSGIHLAPFWLFRAFHPPLFLPWAETRVRLTRHFGAPFVEFSFTRVVGTTILVDEHSGRRIAAEAGPAWPDPAFRNVLEERQRSVAATRTLAVYVAMWIVLVAGIVLGLGNIRWTTYARLSTAGVPVPARVTLVTPRDHARVRYEYMVRGRRYSGRGKIAAKGGNSETGAAVMAWYDPARPEVSCLGDPRPRLVGESIAIALVALIVPPLILLALYYYAGLGLRRRAQPARLAA